MQTTSAPAATAVDEPSFLVRHQFIIYRLFSLCGLVPVGAYVVVHLLTNASIINGPMSFQEQVDRIHALGVVLPVVEWTFIFIPLIFHATVGWLIIAGAMPNTNSYPYASNIRYTLQRATAIIAFVFILIHVIQLHHLAGAPFKEIGGVKFGAQFDPHHAASSTAIALRPLWIKVFYAVGMLSVVYHFANGLWTQGITWGLWTSAAAQRRASWVSVVVGLFLATVGLSALFGMWSVNVDTAVEVENAMEAPAKNCSNWSTRPSLPRPRKRPSSPRRNREPAIFSQPSVPMANQRVMIVGGGLAGLSAAMKLAELGVQVDLMSLTPVKRSHSVCAQGGINSVNEVTRQQGDSEWLHFDDTVYGGDFLHQQPPVKEMAEWAPKIIDLMDRLGVPFNRTPEGFRDQRRFGGTLFKRTAFAGATTGQQLLYALDDQVRRRCVTGQVKIYEAWDYLGPVLDDAGVCRGVVGQDLVTMEIRAFPADAVIVASGGCGLIYGRSTMSMVCTGSAASRTFQAGAKYGNPEFIQVHPTAIPGADKLRLMSESAGAKGAACGCRASRRIRGRRTTSPRASAITSSKSAIRNTATWCRATSPRAKSSASARTTG